MKQVLHKAISRGSAFLVARKRALSSPAIFQTASLSSAQHSISKWDAVRQSSRGSDSNRRLQEQDAKDDEKLQVLRIIVDHKQKDACLNLEMRQRVGGGRILRGRVRFKEATNTEEHAERVLAIGGTCCAKCCATQEAEEEVERFVRNMARTAVIAADAFSGVLLQPKRLRLRKNRPGISSLEYDS